jgi:hypothetical protein
MAKLGIPTILHNPLLLRSSHITPPPNLPIISISSTSSPSIRPLGNSHNAWLNGEYQHHIIIQVAKNGTTGSRDIRSGIPLRAGNVGLIVIDYSLSQSSRRRVREGLRKLGVGVKDGINCLKRTGSILCPEIWCLLFALS